MERRAGTADSAERSYVLAYSSKSREFNFNAMAILAVLLLFFCIVLSYPPLLAASVAAASVAYYYYPLRERTPRIGAGQYGIFVDGLGLIGWRAVKDIRLVPFTSRFAKTYELQIHLRLPLEQALLADWRKLPPWRLLMKLPWNMQSEDVIRIPLEPFEPPAEEIRSQFIQLWDDYR